MSDAAAGTVTVLGSINIDTVLQVARFPLAGETIVAAGTQRHFGGKGANQAIAAARAGARVRLIGTVGDDADGRASLAFLDAEGIDRSGVRIDRDRPTGAAYVTVDGTGENQIIVSAGANAADRAVEACDGVLLAQLEVPAAMVVSFLSQRRPGACAILNAAPFRPDARELLALADIVVVNAIELAGYCGETPPPASAAQAIELAAQLRAGREQTIIVTRGPDGSILVAADGVVETSTAAARVVDTTGAGDCFCGYLAAGLAMGLTPAAAIERAHRAAAISVGRPGTSSSIPRRDELGERPIGAAADGSVRASP